MAIYSFIIPEIEVSGVNLETSYWTVSFPMTALAGFITSFSKGSDPLPIDSWKAAVLLHDYETYPGQSKNPNAMCVGNGSAPAVEKILNTPIVQEVKGQVRFSLYLQLELDEYTALDRNKLKSGFLYKHFAGGNITSFGNKDKTFESIDEGDLIDRLKLLAPGWWIKDRSDLLEGKQGPEKMDAFFDALGLTKTLETVMVKGKETEKTKITKEAHGWLFGTCTGYQLLEPPCKREGRRTKPEEDTPHSFAEPVHGLAELVFSRSLLRSVGADVSAFRNSRCLWHWKTISESRATVLSAFS